MRVGAPGVERAVVLDDEDRAYALGDGIGGDIDGRFLAGDGIARTRAALAAGELAATDIAGERVGPPIARPQAVVCIGMNYAAHAAEAGSAPPASPPVFFKPPNTVVG